MMQRNAKIGALALAVLVVGCAKNDYPLTAQERQLYMPVDRARIAKARDQKIPTIKSETYLAAAKFLEQHGDVSKAIVQYRKAIKAKNAPSEAYHRLGVLLSMIGQNEEATKMLRRAVAISPEQPVLHNDLGFALTMQAQWKEAEREFRKSIAIERRFARAHINLGLTLSKMDRYDEAKAAFLTVLPEEDAYYNLGLMYRSQRRFAEASDAFRHVLEVAPQFTAAASQLDDIRDLVPTQPKTALPSPVDNFATRTIKHEKTRLVKIDKPRSTQPVESQGWFEEFFEEGETVDVAPMQVESPTYQRQRIARVEEKKPVSPAVALAPKSNRSNMPLRDLVRMMQGKMDEEGLIEQWTTDTRNNAANAVTQRQVAHEAFVERESFLGDDEFELTFVELAMSPIGEMIEETSDFSIADDWSAWTYLNAGLMASSFSDEVSVSPWASLVAMDYDLREVQKEINCLEEELEARYAQNQAREVAAVEAMLADATPDENFDWLLADSPVVPFILSPAPSPMVSPSPLYDLENYMPMPPLDQNYISLIAEQVGPSVDIERIWTGESEVGSMPFTRSDSAKPCDIEEARPVLAAKVFESKSFGANRVDSSILESFLLESDRPKRWSPLPMQNRLAFNGLDAGTWFANNDSSFAWINRFAVLDDNLAVLLNDSRCWDEQWRLDESEPERLGYCRSDFVPACEPGITDVPPFLDTHDVTKTNRKPVPWLGSSTNNSGR